jgi:hypothetical protein
MRRCQHRVKTTEPYVQAICPDQRVFKVYPPLFCRLVFGGVSP